MSYSAETIKQVCITYLYQGKVFYQDNQPFKVEGFSSVSGKVSVQNLSTHQYAEINCWDLPEIQQVLMNNELSLNIQGVGQASNQIPLSDIPVWKHILPELENKSNDEIQKYLSELMELDSIHLEALPESIGRLSRLKILRYSLT